MTATWYCTDCDSRLSREEIPAHEARGHHVIGVLRPDRLLPADPRALENEREG